MRAAMFRLEWLDKARQLLPNPADRAIFYECLMCRAFEREQPSVENPIVAAMFAMAESAIAQDLEKYAARCERNRENAAKRYQSQPVAASGSQSLPVAASGYQSLPNTSTSTSTNTNTSTSTSSISIESADEEREKYLIYCTLFARGALDVQSEFDSFYNYYAALGWKNNKGAQIVSKVSAAAMWRFSGDTAANLSEREQWAKAFRNADTTASVVWTAFRHLDVRTTDTERVLHITIAIPPTWLEDFENKCERNIRALMRAYQCTGVEYHCPRN